MAQPFRVSDGDNPGRDLGGWDENGNVDIPGVLTVDTVQSSHSPPELGTITFRSMVQFIAAVIFNETLLQLAGDTVNSPVLTTTVTGFADDTFSLSAGGGMDWGGGSGAFDTNLYRSGAGVLRTDSTFLASGVRVPQAEFTPQDHGFEAWTFDPYYPASSVITVNSRIYLVKVLIRRNVTVDTIWWSVATAGATPTAGQNEVGLYSSAGTRLAATNVDAVISSTGAKSTAITPQALTGGTFVWVGFVFNAATPPTLARGSSFETTPNINLAAATLRSAVNGTGTVLPASIVPASNSTSNSLTLFAALEEA